MSRERQSYQTFARWLHAVLQRRDNSEPPPIRHLSLLVEELLWTSIEHEEGRGVKCSILYAPLDSHEHETHSRLEFKTPLPFTSGTLRRLGSATDPGATFIEVGPAVVESTDAAALLVRGLVRLSSQELSARASSSLQDLPQWNALNLRIGGPGVVHVYLGNLRVGTYSKGETLFELPATGDERFEDILPADTWTREYIDTIGKDVHLSYQPVLSSLYLNALVSLLRRIEELDTGGTLLVVPRDSTPTAVGRTRYEADPPYLGMTLALAESFAAYGQRGIHETWAEVDNQARLIAELSGSDGAVLIDRSFRFLGAGVELTMETDSSERITVIGADSVAEYLNGDASAGVSEPLDALGMRHRSAVSFVKNTAGSIAFVVSQDGGISVVCRPIRFSADVVGREATHEVVRIKGFRVWAPHRSNE